MSDPQPTRRPGSLADRCPFCGDERVLAKLETGLHWVAECEVCHARGPTKPTAQSAVDAWNTRLVPEPKSSAIVTPRFAHRLIVKTTLMNKHDEIVGTRYWTIPIESDELTRALFAGESHSKACVIGCESRRVRTGKAVEPQPRDVRFDG